MTNNPQPGQIVNRLGKYLYKHLDNATDIEYTPNTCEVSLVVLYEIPRDVIRMYPEEFKQVPDEVYEMGISLNFTTYANKVRLNVISRNPDEKTLGQKIYPCEKLTNSFEAQNLIMEDVCKILYKNFSNYEFIF